jgi:type IV pilus assembly protein PilA
MKSYKEERNEKGFTLIELLVAIVVVGILTAVAIVGIAGLQNNGSKSACSASLDAAKAATAVHYANNHGIYPAQLGDFTPAASPAEWEAPNGVAPVADSTTVSHITTNGWTLTMTAGTGLNAPTFACTP